MTYKEEFIEFMVRCGVLTFGDFITKSGRRTPFFVNTGKYGTGGQIGKLGEYYARAIHENLGDGFTVLFGPAYKGIPLAVAAAISLRSLFNKDAAFCFNRKEEKDHGEGGSLVGHRLQDGDRVVIVEDVTTAGTSVYETVPMLEKQAKITLAGLVVSVDRMERGSGEMSALDELREHFGFKTFPIVTMKDVVNYLHGREIDGSVLVDGAMKVRIDEYYDRYGAR